MMQTMERDISSEQLPRPDCDEEERSTARSPIQLPQETDIKSLTPEEISERLETILLERVKAGNKTALFQLGQLYFEQHDYDKAIKYFERAGEKGDLQATFQLGIIYYDGLASVQDYCKGFENMTKVANSSGCHADHLLFAARYNVGRAYFQGYGVQQSDAQAERHWLLAADDGNPKASIKAQSVLGMFYSRPDTGDLKKAFFWHSEACGNGSLESQGALGMMYLKGLGCKQDGNSAFVCFREAAERGNVYAMGNLVAHYYKCKLYTKAVDLAARLAQLDDVMQIADETDCLPAFVQKGIAMGCFYYARLLHKGLGIKKDSHLAKEYYSKSYSFDPDTCANLQGSTQHGEI